MAAAAATVTVVVAVVFWRMACIVSGNGERGVVVRRGSQQSRWGKRRLEGAERLSKRKWTKMMIVITMMRGKG